MGYEVRVVEVGEGQTAVVDGRATKAELAKKIRELFDEFYKNVGSVDAGKRGLNIIVYRDQAGADLLSTTEGVPLEIGVQVPSPFQGNGVIRCSKTPAGRAATVVHMGAYDKMGAAYDALFKWRRDRGESFAGPFWEVYGHWSDDPTQVRTDIYYLLK